MLLRKEQQEFLYCCIDLLYAKGQFMFDDFGYMKEALIYDDSVMRIVKDEGEMYIIRKFNSNLIFLGEKNKILRLDLEYVLLEYHLADVFPEFTGNILNRTEFPPEEPGIAMPG